MKTFSTLYKYYRRIDFVSTMISATNFMGSYQIQKRSVTKLKYGQYVFIQLVSNKQQTVGKK